MVCNMKQCVIYVLICHKQEKTFVVVVLLSFHLCFLSVDLYFKIVFCL